MDDRMERYLVTAFDDAVAQVPLPPHERWIPADRRARGSGGLVTMAAGALLIIVVGIALWLGVDGRIVPASGPAKPLPPGAIVLVPGGSEAQTWGKVWSVSAGATVLRPTWLPISGADTTYDVTTSSRLQRYVVAYSPRGVFPLGPRPPLLLFIGEGPDVIAARLAPGESSLNITVRGQDARLITATDGAPRVIWTENGIRYTIQGTSALAPNDLLRVAESLAPVADADGNTR